MLKIDKISPGNDIHLDPLLNSTTPLLFIINISNLLATFPMTKKGSLPGMNNVLLSRIEINLIISITLLVTILHLINDQLFLSGVIYLRIE